ncbi:MAG: gluconokinase [Paracoccaceae bacterium]
MTDQNTGYIIFVIGVSGCGKSTVAQALAQEFGAAFLEGDAFHPPENVAQMAAGLPLNDEMRWPWLRALGQAAAQAAKDNPQGVFVACSALRRSYRDLLRDETGGAHMILLTGDPALIHARMSARQDHYMPPALLKSQLATLEPPQADEPAISVLNIEGTQSEVLAQAKNLLNSVI